MSRTPIIIKKVHQEDHAGHHGGGWKIAYADFMTAMMAFFLLMWLLGAADDEQLEGLAEYFTPGLVDARGGGQGVLGGEIALAAAAAGSPDRAGFDGLEPLAVFDSRVRRALAEEKARDAGKRSEKTQASGPSDADAARERRLRALAEEIAAVVAGTPEIADLHANLRLDVVAEGLDVRIVDSERRSMFAVGSAELDGQARRLVRAVAVAVADTAHPIMVAGHTDGRPFRSAGGYGNWELSTDRAHATRRELIAAGVGAARLVRVSGLADTQPLDPRRPNAAQNRRIDILIRDVRPADGP